MTPPKSIHRKCTDMRKPIQRVKFTKAIARHTKKRDQNPSLGFFPGEPHKRSPNAPKFVIVPWCECGLDSLGVFGIVFLGEDVPFCLHHAGGSHIVHGPGSDFS